MDINLVKEHLRLGSSTEEDGILNLLIAMAYQYVEKHTGTSVKKVPQTVSLDAFPQNKDAIELKYTPVISIDEITYLNPIGDLVYMDLQDVHLDTRPVFPRIVLKAGGEWPSVHPDQMSINVTVTVGFDSVPEDIAVAMLLIIGHLYANREATTFGSPLNELPFGVSSLLAPYTIPRFG